MSDDSKVVALRPEMGFEDPESFAKMIEVEKKKRALITEYISDQMVEGVDYGAIHVKKDCENQYTCENKFHYTKSILFKPGSEKFCSLMHIRPKFTYEHVDWEKGNFVLKCELYSRNDVVIGEGRGAARLSEKTTWTMNNCLKIAEKRAQIDAVLRSGGLSDFFTQDLEDDVEATKAEVSAERSSPSSPSSPQGAKPIVREPNAPASPAQVGKLFAELNRTGFTKEQLEAKHGAVEHILKGKMSQIIDSLVKLPAKKSDYDLSHLAKKDDLPVVQIDEETKAELEKSLEGQK